LRRKKIPERETKEKNDISYEILGNTLGRKERKLEDNKKRRNTRERTEIQSIVTGTASVKSIIRQLVRRKQI
jgi:hypothetical protein